MKVLRIRVYTSGLEKIPKNQKLMFVGNHRSNFDPIIEWLVLKPWDIAFISKGENFKIPFFGRIIRKCCFMPIDRENPRKALRTINKASDLLQSGEVSIGVYPEGTRSKTGELLPFHDGVFHIAKKAGTPIVVMSIRGTEQIHKNVLRRHSDVYLDIVQVIPASDVENGTTHTIGAEIRNMLLDSIKDKYGYRLSSADHKMLIKYHLWYTACDRMEASQKNEVHRNGKSSTDFIQGFSYKVCNRSSLSEIYV